MNIYDLIQENLPLHTLLLQHETILRNTPINSSNEVILSSLNITKAITFQTIKIFFGQASQFNVGLETQDVDGNNVLHILFSLLQSPQGIYQDTPKQNLEKLVMHLFTQLLDCFPNFLQIFHSVVFQQNRKNLSPLQILTQVSNVKLIFICLILSKPTQIPFIIPPISYLTNSIFSSLSVPLKFSAPTNFTQIISLNLSGATTNFLKFASSLASVNVCKTLNMDFNEQFEQGKGALHFGVENLNENGIALMCKYGAEDRVNYKGDSALIFAAKLNKLKSAKTLIFYGSDIDICDSKDRTLLDLCNSNDENWLNLLFGSDFRPRNPEELRYRRDYLNAVKVCKLTKCVDLDCFVKFCRACESQFTFKNRRSHCRTCGRIFCRNCVIISELGKFCGECAKKRERKMDLIELEGKSCSKLDAEDEGVKTERIEETAEAPREEQLENAAVSAATQQPELQENALPNLVNQVLDGIKAVYAEMRALGQRWREFDGVDLQGMVRDVDDLELRFGWIDALVREAEAFE
ncbi:FYVE zinc finger domain-containing protein [Spironucleus salmonicida]|uniref:FYVE zinc finger domain-containing protein n=1 Tax=Spironucleus salmonicida TaxID=348837 RepID=V6LDP1_9EUKA|nr:FYVE zinc finger domain-containing protein [Spironucleus salmonicida]|eukprot:EST42602.1 FYVE zinc finger domain-containing protein [Spironucleus salmonicida]